MSEEDDEQLQQALTKAGASLPAEMMAQVQLMVGMFSAAARYESETRKYEADRNADVQREGILAQKERDAQWIKASDDADKRRHDRSRANIKIIWACVLGGLAIAGVLIYLREFHILTDIILASGMYFAFRAGQKQQTPPTPPPERTY